MFHFIEEEETDPVLPEQPKRPDWLVDKDDDLPKFTISEADPSLLDLPTSTTTTGDLAPLPEHKLNTHPSSADEAPPQWVEDDTPLVRVEFEYADGRIQRLTGNDAIEWMKDINGPIIAQAIRYGTQQIRNNYPWKWSKRTDETPPVGWQRVQRRIYSPFWRAMHNLVAHPWLVICRPIGEILHEFTAERMYTPKGDKPPIVSDAD